MRLHDQRGGMSTRRQALMMSGTALLTSMAGCATIRDFTSDVALEEVNVFNMVNRQIKGSIEVVAPAGDIVVERTFELEHEEDQNIADVFGVTGEYVVNVELINTEIAGTSQAIKTVSIDDTNEQRIGAVLNTTQASEPIVIRVGTTPKDFLEVGI
jgi:hypothetical protein